MVFQTLSTTCFFIAIGLIIVSYFLEFRVIGIMKRVDPENWTAYTRFFGQQLKFRKLRGAMAEGKISDPQLIQAVHLWKALWYPVWIFVAGFLAFLAAA